MIDALQDATIRAAEVCRKVASEELTALRALYAAVRERDSLAIEDAVFRVASAQIDLAIAEAKHAGLMLALTREEARR
jgi:hypothetical protein